MLKISKQEIIAGVTVFGDDTFDDVFYPIPDSPRFRVDDTGTPVFKFLKYRNPIDHPSGRRGGGFVFFDTEFSLTPTKLAELTEELQARVQAMAGRNGFRSSTPGPPAAHIGTMTYTRGTAGLLLREDDGGLVEAVRSAGKPSLFGKNVSAFMVEFSPEGATLFEQALQGKGGVVQVVYDLHFWAKLPELYARAWFEAETFYSYEQTIDIDWSLYGDDEYVENLVEQFESEEAMGIDIDFSAVLPDPEADRKLKERIRANMERSLQDAVLRKMIPDIEAVPLDERGMPEDVEELRRSFETTKVASFSSEYRENTAIEWNIAPQGTLPNITNLVDNEGKAIRWDDHATLVDLDDPFFEQLNVKVGVNADFGALPIHSIEVKLDYQHGSEHAAAEYSFTSPDHIETFRTHIDGGHREYTYSYQVNYVGSSRTFQSSPTTTDDNVLTVNVDDIGLLDVEVQAGDIDFDKVTSAQVTLRYQDTGVETFEHQFALTKDVPSTRVQHVLFQPRRKPIEYRVDYFLTDGRQIVGDWNATERSPLLINDPLGRTRRFEIRAVGDFTTRIDQIMLDLAYRDDANDYSVEKSYVLTAGNEAVSEPFAVLGDGGGVVTYRGFIRYHDGTVSEIVETVADGTIVVGDVVAAKLTVSVVPTLLDWTQVRLARVALRHGDDVTGTSADLIFSAQTPNPQSWEVLLDDPAERSYRWQATYFSADNTQTSTAWVTTTEPSIVLQAPAMTTPVPTPGPTPTPDPVPTPVPTPDPVPTPVPTPDPVPTPVPTPDPVPTPVPTPEPVPEPAPTPTPPVSGGSPPPPPVPGGSPPPPPVPGGTPSA
jgi:hypothetical protein